MLRSHPRGRSIPTVEKVFTIPNVITLDTTGLDGIPFDWRHYGGPLAMFRLCRFVRIQILKDQPASRKLAPIPGNVIYQQGDLILKKMDEIPLDAVPVEVERLPNGGIPLGGEHTLYPGGKEQEDDA